MATFVLKSMGVHDFSVFCAANFEYYSWNLHKHLIISHKKDITRVSIAIIKRLLFKPDATVHRVKRYKLVELNNFS